MVDRERIAGAYETVRRELLEERNANGHWTGKLSASALSTATALSALALAEPGLVPSSATGEPANARDRLIPDGIRWLLQAQNPDGGWGDTDKSKSNIATTMLVVAAFHLTQQAETHATILTRAERYIRERGGIAGLRRRYGIDKTFAVPILTNYALAGLVPWSEVSPLPFELACLPQSWFGKLQLPVVSYAIPALVAVGQARFFHEPPTNRLVYKVSSLAVERSLEVLQRMQPSGGGFLEATPLTSFVVMSLASIGRLQHPVCCRGVEFLVRSVLSDGSWPIDTNLATWLTTLSINSLAATGSASEATGCIDWLLSCQQTEKHPFTGAAPGGWGWSDLSGAVPDADDTAGALLALAKLSGDDLPEETRNKILCAVVSGTDWLLALQNRDGGWPTFCRGWGKLPFDRSGTDLTAHVLRALRVWHETRLSAVDGQTPAAERIRTKLNRRFDLACRRGFRYLARQQQADGSWLPLWFGNHDQPDDANPVYGTGRVLLAYRDFGRIDSHPARRALAWLVANQNEDGGWGGGRPIQCGTGESGAASGDLAANGDLQGARTSSVSFCRVACDVSAPDANPGSQLTGGVCSSMEETAIALEALLGHPTWSSLQNSINKGLNRLVEAVEGGRHRETSPIGFYFARLWYYERLYPLVFLASALGHAVGGSPPGSEPTPALAHLQTT